MADDDFDSLHRTHDGTEYLYGRGDYSEYLICNVSDVALTDFILEENDLCVLESNGAAWCWHCFWERNSDLGL